MGKTKVTIGGKSTLSPQKMPPLLPPKIQRSKAPTIERSRSRSTSSTRNSRDENRQPRHRSRDDVYQDIQRQVTEANREETHKSMKPKGNIPWSVAMIKANRIAIYMNHEAKLDPKDELMQLIALETAYFKARWHNPASTKNGIKNLFNDYKPDPYLFEWCFLGKEKLSTVAEDAHRRSEAQVAELEKESKETTT